VAVREASAFVQKQQRVSGILLCVEGDTARAGERSSSAAVMANLVRYPRHRCHRLDLGAPRVEPGGVWRQVNQSQSAWQLTTASTRTGANGTSDDDR
jgi:hypothetical protein